MNIIDKIKTKLPGTENYYNQKALIWRNRGDSYALEIIDAVRIKYKDEPDIHELSTGEEIPAVPKNYVQNMFGGGSYFCAVEGNDDQLVVFKQDFTVDKDTLENLDTRNTDKDVKKQVNKNSITGLDTDLEGEDLETRLIDKNFDAVNFCVLDNRDERFTFLSNEIETAQDKYNGGSLLWDNKDIVLTVTTAVAVAIIMYTVGGDMITAVENFTQSANTLTNEMEPLAEAVNNSEQRSIPG